MKPAKVTIKAVNFRYSGIVIWGTVAGVMLLEIRNPAKILPINRRIIGFISEGLFSLIKIREGNRGFPSKAKKMIRVL